jgi:hypothetical protein
MIPRSLFLLSLFIATPQATYAQASLEEMKKRCEAAREDKIAPLREAAIEDCVAQRRSNRTREDCERIYRDFGEVGATVTGGVRPRMFDDLPECIEYHEALNSRGRGRSSR